MESAIIAAFAAVAIGVVVWPLLRRNANDRNAHPQHRVQFSDQAIDEQVARYRAAIKDNTVCERCLTGNPPGSRFCAECGQPL